MTTTDLIITAIAIPVGLVALHAFRTWLASKTLAVWGWLFLAVQIVLPLAVVGVSVLFRDTGAQGLAVGHSWICRVTERAEPVTPSVYDSIFSGKFDEHGDVVLKPSEAKSARPFTVDCVEGRVVSVHDGDTMTIVYDEHREKIRLRDIDAPELAQPFGPDARDAAAELVLDNGLSITISGTDRYGLALATVRRLADAQLDDLSAQLIRNGWAWWYREYSSDEALGRLEAEARGARRGLWADPEPTPPWVFREGSISGVSP
jgi:endonuclease YncB( thermonuclease family)